MEREGVIRSYRGGTHSIAILGHTPVHWSGGMSWSDLTLHT